MYSGRKATSAITSSRARNSGRAAALFREAHANARFLLKMITRSPLPIPCLTDKYGATFPDRSGLYPGPHLALRRDRQFREPLPRIAHLSHAEQLQVEDQNVIDCLTYARERLGL